MSSFPLAAIKDIKIYPEKNTSEAAKSQQQVAAPLFIQ